MKLNIELGSPLIRTVLQGLGPNVKSAFLDNAFWIESVVARVPNLDTYVYRDYEYKPLFSDTEHIGDFLRSFLSHHSCSQDVIHFVILKRLDIRSADCHVPWELLVNLEQLKCDVVCFTPDCQPPKLRDLEVIACNEDFSDIRCCRSLRNLKVNVVTVICPVRNYAVDGLGEFPLLEHLNVYDWNLMNLKSIGYIESLRFLEVESEYATNLSTLSNLQHLKELNLILPNAIDISPLKSLTSLSNLFFVSHKHLDLSPLQHLINLKCLGLNQTVQHDLTVLAALVNLREIDLSEALKLNSIQFVAGMMQLETLILTQSVISNLTPLKNCSQLKVLKLEETAISDISTLKYLPQLEILMLRSTMVSDLSALEALTTLVELDVSDTQVTNLNPIANAAQLKILLASNCRISNEGVQALTTLRCLNRLSLQRNVGFSDLLFLQYHKTLKELFISDTSVADLSPLAEIFTLRKLQCTQTKITTLEPLKGIRLRNLNCEHRFFDKTVENWKECGQHCWVEDF